MRWSRSGPLRPSTYLIVGLLAALTASTSSSHGQSVDDFYKGRQLKFIVGSAGGGGYEFYSRLLTRHMTRFIPGNPHFVIQNMPGAGGVIAANYLFNIAPQDGSEIGMVGRATATQTLLQPEDTSVKFAPRQFKWIGSPQQEVGLLLVRLPSPINTIGDLRKHEVIVSGTARMGPPSFYPRVMNGLLGTKFKVIEGYKSSQEALLALERGEVAGHASGSSAGPLRERIDPWIKAGQVKVVAQIGITRDSEFSGVPTVLELAETEEQRAVLRLIFAQQVLAWPIVAPPRTPGERVTALRHAFDRSVADLEFLEEARKAGLMINPVSGKAADEFLAEVYMTSDDVVSATRNLMK